MVQYTVRGEQVAISEAEMTKQNNLANKFTKTVSRNCMVLDQVKIVFNVAVAFRKEYNEKFAALV